MPDLITISDLELQSHIGVSDDERSQPQRILVTVEMSLDTSAAANDDDVKKSINYFDVTQDLKLLAKTERKTIERLAEDTAAMILKKHQAKDVTVTVKKFAIPEAQWVSVKIVRSSPQ